MGCVFGVSLALGSPLVSSDRWWWDEGSGGTISAPERPGELLMTIFTVIKLFKSRYRVEEQKTHHPNI